MRLAFADLVRDKVAPTLEQHGFRLTESSTHSVTFDSPGLRCGFTLDPRGELDVTMYRTEYQHWEGWNYCGFVGRADVARLLEMAVAEMEADPRLLSGDPDLYRLLAVQRRQEKDELNAWASGTGPRPKRKGPLP